MDKRTDGGVVAQALKDSIPVLFGYLPLGIVFGLLFTQHGHPWYLAPIMSLLSYAGTTQLIAISMIDSHTSLISLFLTVLVIDLRHVFYSVSLVNRFPRQWSKKGYLAHGLTDETYSILTSGRKKEKEDAKYCFLVTGFNHLYWVLGTALGALFGLMISVDIPALKFVLNALFIVLAVEQWQSNKDKIPFAVGLFAGMLAIGLSNKHMLLLSLAISTLIFMLKEAKEKTVCPT